MFDINTVKSSMGAVVIGGTIASMIFSFIIAPVMFSFIVKIFYKNKA